MPFWNRSKKDQYLAEARKFKRRREFDRAGDNYYLAGSVDDALQMYVEGGHHKLAAQLLEKQGDERRAADSYVQAREYRSAANLYLKLGEQKRAAQLFEKLGEYFKAAQIEDELRAFGRAAELYKRSGHRDRAAASFSRAGDHQRAATLLYEHLTGGGLSSNKDQAEKQWISCAELFERAGMHAKAGAVWERVSRHGQAARSFEKAGEVSRAIELYVRAGDAERAGALTDQAPDGSVKPQVLAELCYARGDWQRAAELYATLGNSSRAAVCYANAGDKVAAAEQYELAGEVGMAAELLDEAGEYARASQLFEGALRPAQAARAAHKAGEAERAAILFEEASEPIEAARCWHDVGEDDKSIALLQQVTPDQEGYLGACLLLGDAFRAKGLHGIAVEKYQAAIQEREVQSDTLEAFYGLALAHEDREEYDKAVAIHERIVAVSYGFKDSAARTESLRQAAAQAAQAAQLSSSSGVGLPTSVDDTVDLSGESGAHSVAGLVGHRYEIVSRLASSRRGDVFRAWDTSLSRTVCLKPLAKPGTADDATLQRYLRDARSASKLHHSNIATIYDALDLPEGRVVAMEFVHGQSLRDVLSSEGPLTPGRAVEITAQIVRALEYAHNEDVLHGNLRPENVLLGEKSHVKLTDFGLARRYADLAEEPYSETSPLHYLSPEQIGSDRDPGTDRKIDHRADIYAVGCILYEMLAGVPPFTGSNVAARHQTEEPVPPSSHTAGIPKTLDSVVLDCLRKNPAERTESAAKIADALRAFDFVPGQRLGERYELINEIGAGGMGKVYVAKDLELEEKIAMKVLRPEFGSDPLLEARFIREIKLARKVVHPGVVKVYDFGKWKGVKYITMEYIEGISLEEYVRRRGRPDVIEVSELMLQICDALTAAHRLGVVHRDIKPQNVLISSDGRAKIVDFGIARIDQNEDLTSAEHVIGSPKYMSPEQIRGQDIDARTDVYSLGLVMYYCFTGIEAVQAEDTNKIILQQLRQRPVPPCQVNPELPPWVDMVVLRCLVKDPAGRYQSIEELAADLRSNVAADSQQSSP